MGLNTDVGAKIRSLRHEKKFTTTQLAKMVDVSQAQISRLEMGKQGFRMSTLDRIAKALGVQAAVFLNGERDKAVETAMANSKFKGFVKMAAKAFNEGNRRILQVPDK